MIGRQVCVGLMMAVAVLLCGGCSGGSGENGPIKPIGRVSVYCALDLDLAEPVFAVFEGETHIKVDIVADTEATKTTGLVNRLIAERDNPRADVFWNNEVVQTIRLQREGLLEAYRSPSADGIGAKWRDADNYWTGFAARGRVLIVNTGEHGETDLPDSVNDLTAARYRDSAALARPLFGTTLSHMVALAAADADAMHRFIEGCITNQVHIESSNGAVARAVAEGRCRIGLTDTDDVRRQLDERKPVCMVWPDQGENHDGALLIPNSVCLIRNARNPDLARQLIDFLLSPRVEQMLAEGPGAQIPVRPDVPRPSGKPHLNGDLKLLDVDWSKVGEHFDESLAWLAAQF